MNRFIASSLILSVAGCATSDLSTSLTETRTQLTTVTAQVKPSITPLAVAERARAQDRAIQEDRPVIGLSGDCDTVASRSTPQVLSTCSIVEFFDPADDPGSATEVLEFLDIMDVYLTSLEALAASQTPQEARAQAQAVIVAFGTADASRPAMFERLGATLRDRKDLIGEGTGFLVNQARITALRRVIKDADIVIAEAVPIVATHLSFLDEDLLAAQAELLDAQEAAVLIEGASDPAGYRLAVARLRTSHAAFLKAEAESPVIRLFLFRQAHARLLERATTGITPTEFVNLLEDLRALRDAAQQET
ncbi:MAG: hypothetical protein ACPG6L_08535 [Nereida ignava]